MSRRDHVNVIDLVGVPAVDRKQAERNVRNGVHPPRPRRGRPGLVPLTAAEVWQRVADGTFPRPVRHPVLGLGWPRESIDQWRRRHNEEGPVARTTGPSGNNVTKREQNESYASSRS